MRTQVFCSVGLLRATIAPPSKLSSLYVGFFTPSDYTESGLSLTNPNNFREFMRFSKY